MFNLLFIEEKYETREIVKDYFRSGSVRGFSIDFACDCHDGLEKVRSISYDLLFVDIRISGSSGLDICRLLRENCSCPIVYITDLNDECEIDQCYALCADDYLIKPFTPSDIFNLALEYSGNDQKGVNMLECSGIRMNPVTGLVTVDGRIVELAPRPTKILRLLLENKNAAVSRDEILSEVWGYDYCGNERVVDNHISNLRQILGKKGDLIKNVRGIGYRIREK